MRITRLVAAAAVALAVAMATPALGVDTGNCPSPTAYTGAGTVGDPLLISTPGKLQKLRDTPADWSKYVRLSADINMAGASACTWGSSFGPSPAFTGTFDGAGHVVSGLNIATPSTANYAGFIAYLGANGVVKDLGFTGNVTVALNRGGDAEQAYVGGLVGFTYAPTTIARSWASGQVSGTVAATGPGFAPGPPMALANLAVGGIVGYSQSTVTDVYFTGSLGGGATATMSGGSGSATASARGGGIAGALSGGSISNAYSTATAPSFSLSATGGSSRTTTTYSGGLVGSKSAAVNYSFWNSDAWAGNGAGQNGPAGTGTTAAGLASFATFGPSGGNWSITNGLPASTTWGICPAANGGTPFLAAFASASTCIATPNTPATPTAVAGNGQATVTVAQGSGAGDPPDSYLVTSNPDAHTCTVTGASGSCDVIGLTNGTDYTFTATATNLGGSSSASGQSNIVTPMTAASAPTGLVATAGDQSIDVAFTAGANGGSSISNYEYRLNGAGSWTAFSPAQTTSPVTIGGLTNGTPYTVELRAVTGYVSPGTASSATSSVTPQPPVPDAPATPTAVAGNGQATVTVAQGPGPGGTPASYLVTSSPDGRTCTVTGASGSCDVTGLTNGTSYTFTATATNGGGTSAASVASNAVTPVAPPSPAQPQSNLLSSSPVVDPPVPVVRRNLAIAGVDLTNRGQVVTSGRVPQGATSVVQVGRPSAASLGWGSRANARISANCPISGQGSARTFRCSMRLSAGRWVLTTQARNGATVIASSARSVVIKAVKRTAVTG